MSLDAYIERLEILVRVARRDLAAVNDPIIKACARRRVRELEQEIVRQKERARWPRLFT
jgi:hypothetical protein